MTAMINYDDTFLSFTHIDRLYNWNDSLCTNVNGLLSLSTSYSYKEIQIITNNI